jgi:hypothetical protein
MLISNMFAFELEKLKLKHEFLKKISSTHL